MKSNISSSSSSSSSSSKCIFSNVIDYSINFVYKKYNLSEVDSFSKDDYRLFIFNSVNYFSSRSSFMNDGDTILKYEKVISKFIIDTIPSFAKSVVNSNNFYHFMKQPCELVCINENDVKTVSCQSRYLNDKEYKDILNLSNDNFYNKHLIVEKDNNCNNPWSFTNLPKNVKILPYLIYFAIVDGNIQIVSRDVYLESA